MRPCTTRVSFQPIFLLTRPLTTIQHYISKKKATNPKDLGKNRHDCQTLSTNVALNRARKLNNRYLHVIGIKTLMG